MDISPLSHAVKASDLPLEQLAGNPRLTEEEKIGELSRQFEALLLRQILAEAHKTVIKSSLNKDSAVSGMYQDMVTNALAESISKTGTLGLASQLREQLGRQLPKSAQKEPSIEN